MAPITTILVPVDFSDWSRFAVREAAGIAGRLGSKLLLLHVVPSVDSGFTQFHGQESLGEREAYTAGELSQVAAREAPESSCEEMVLIGDVSQTVRKLVEERSIDLIVMPTHGGGTFREFLVGSNTAKVLHDVQCPILTGAHRDQAPDACFPYCRIGCLIDLRDGSDQVLQDASDFARAYRADLTAIHVARTFENGPGVVSDYAAALGLSARRQMQKLIERMNVEAVGIVASGDLVATVREQIEKNKLDLLIIGRSGATEEEIQSDAYDLISRLPCPVLSVSAVGPPEIV
jgi:nucleotide-binding universal stress UspA family protein